MKNLFAKLSFLLKNSYFKFSIIFIIIFTFIGLINFLVNPYGIFSVSSNRFTILKPSIKGYDLKFTALKLDKRILDSVFIGSSKTDYSIDRTHYFEITGKQAVNMASEQYNLEDYPDILQSILNIHPEISNIFIELDFEKFNSNHNKNKFKLKKNKDLTIMEIYKILFSPSCLKDSILTIFTNISGKKDNIFNIAGTKIIYTNNNIKEEIELSSNYISNKFKTFKYNRELFNTIYELQKICNEKNINLYIYIMPTHIMYMNLMQEDNVYETYFSWKEELSKIIPIYDFQYPCEITNELISPYMKYFFNIINPTNITGKIILEAMLQGNLKFGRLYTYDYAEVFNNSDKNEMEMLKVIDKQEIYD